MAGLKDTALSELSTVNYLTYELGVGEIIDVSLRSIADYLEDTLAHLP